jgi:hypothetical protein
MMEGMVVLIAEECYNLGCDGYIVKPVGEMLIETIRQVAKRV